MVREITAKSTAIPLMRTTAAPIASRIQPRWGAVCMLLSIVFFSINSLTLKYLAQSNISPWVAMLIRAVVGMVLVLSLFRFDGKNSLRRAATDRMLVYRGLFGVMGTMAYYLTVPALGPGKATLISNMYVVLAALLAVWILKESFTAGKLLGNGLAFIGLTLLIASPAQLTIFGWYELLAVFGAFMAAGTVIVIRKLTQTESTAIIYTSQCIYVLVGSLPFAVFELLRQGVDFSGLVVLVLAGVSATFGQLAMTEGFRHLTVAVGGVFQICVPVVIAIGGVTLFGESFSTLQIVGALLILGGCYWVMIAR